jgi:LemA protein
MTLPHRLSFLVPAVLALSACGLNSVPEAQEAAKARWADVQNEYQRRSDLIPNLVSTVKAAGAQEQATLTKVTEARARATSINITTDDLSNPAEFRKYQEAQNQLTQAMGQLRTVVEAYPQLQTNQNFLGLQAQLEGTENQIRIARRDYNAAVQAYNTRIRTFPDAIGAKIFHGAQPMVPFEAVSQNAEVAPTVKF